MTSQTPLQKDIQEILFTQLGCFLFRKKYTNIISEDILESIIKKNFTKSDTETFLFGKLHSINDNPSNQSFSNKFWHRNGVLHRDNDLPAVISGNGLEWWKNGKRHRDTQDSDDNDLPAVDCDVYLTQWYSNGVLHRDGDKPASLSILDKWCEWYCNGVLYRSTREERNSEITREDNDVVEWYPILIPQSCSLSPISLSMLDKWREWYKNKVLSYAKNNL